MQVWLGLQHCSTAGLYLITLLCICWDFQDRLGSGQHRDCSSGSPSVDFSALLTSSRDLVRLPPQVGWLSCQCRTLPSSHFRAAVRYENRRRDYLRI